MPAIYLPEHASRARIRHAERARDNRREIIRERSWGRVTRRDLFKWGLFTSAGLLAPINGLNPFPTAEANLTEQVLDPRLGAPPGARGPIEGRPPGKIWAHQRFAEHAPRVAVEAAQAPATTNATYNAGVPSSLNSGIDPTAPLPLQFHPQWPVQNPQSVWTFNGTIPPKLVLARYGEPILFRHHNGLPFDVAQNGGFGRHTISTHEHNGHHGAENDGFAGAFFFPNQFYDYHW